MLKALVAVERKALEDLVDRVEGLPRWLSSCFGEECDQASLNSCVALALPNLVGRNHEDVFEGELLGCEAMRTSEAGKLQGDADRQQVLPGCESSVGTNILPMSCVAAPKRMASALTASLNRFWMLSSILRSNVMNELVMYAKTRRGRSE